MSEHSDETPKTEESFIPPVSGKPNVAGKRRRNRAGGLFLALLALALILGGIFMYWFCKNHGLNIWQIFDIAAPTVIMAQGIGRWGNFMNQEAFGAHTSLTFLEHLHLPNFIIQQMFIDGFYCQPTFLYESIWDLSGFALLMIMRHSDKLFKRGEIFLAYVMWYSFGRFFTEGMRTDSLMFGPLRISQILSIFLFFGAMGLMIYRRHKINNLVWYDYQN